MELFVLGPAFGLPSIDAECIAAVALLRSRLEEGWSVVPTHDQTRRLPCLVDDETCSEGFQRIAQRISHLVEGLNAQQLALSTAISSFLESHAQTLLDISLYVSFENYSSTRSAFTKILPWHANYIIPPARRKAARMRTEHLGISSIDVDDVHDDMSGSFSSDVGKEKSFEAETQKRASMLLGRKGALSRVVQKAEHSAVFKLHALADNFFAPLEALLGDGEYFLGSREPQAVDCLVHGYLSLMLFPQLPQDWLAKTMRQKYRKLVRFTERMHEKLGLRTDVHAVKSLPNCKTSEEMQALRTSNNLTLPWSPSAISSTIDIARTICSDLFDRIPLLSLHTSPLLPPTPPGLWQKYLPTIIITTASTLGLLTYYAFSTGFWAWPRGEELQVFGRKRLTDYGHLGAALAGVSVLSRPQRPELHDEVQIGPIGVEVEVEKNGRG